MKTDLFYRIILLFFACALFWIYPYLGFSLYAVLSSVVLGAYLFSFYLRRKETDAFPYWIVLLTLSLMVTTHYLRPRNGEYTNTDPQVFALTRVEKADTLSLLNPDETGLWPVSSMGQAWVADGRLHLNAVDVPIYDGDSLVNGFMMPSFKEVLSYDGVSIRFSRKVPGIFSRWKGAGDSLLIDVSFSATGNSYKPAFYKPLKKGYNLFDLLHKSVDYDLADERLLAPLRDVLILRYQDGYALTYEKGLSSVALRVDHKPYRPDSTIREIPLDTNNALNVGMKSAHTHPMRFSSQGSTVVGEYLFPYLYRLPGRVGENKRLLVTSSHSRLGNSSISEVLLFEHLNEQSDFRINGSISYRVGESDEPFVYTLYSEVSTSIPNAMVSPNGAIWHTRLTDTRYQSAITGQSNLLLHPTCLLGLLFLLYVLIFIAAEFRAGYAGHIAIFTGCVMMVFITVGLWVTWRVAVFSPVDHISLPELQRYTLEHWYNPIFGYLLAGLIFALLVAFGLFLCRYLPSGKSTVITCSVGVVVTGLVGKWADSTLGIALPVFLYVLGSYLADRRGLGRKWRLGLWGLTEGLLFWVDPGFCFIFMFVSVFYWIFSSSWGTFRKSLLLLATVALALGSAYLFIGIFDQSMTGDLLSNKRHFYYRAAVQSNIPIEELMMQQSIDERDADRLQEAYQNQWFIEYYDKQGRSNRSNGRLFNLEPWHNKGVSYPTQISDLVLSRFLVGEISDWFPLCLGFVVLVFLSGCLLFRLESGTSRVAKFVGVLLFIQVLFVYLSCSNRITFFGEDLIFISQTSKVMTLFFAGMMALPILLPETEGERNRLWLTTCLQYLLSIVGIGLVVYLFSDQKAVEEDFSYNLRATIERAQQELKLINAKLQEAKVPTQPIVPNSDLSQLIDQLDEDVHLTQYVNDLYDRGRISKFTASLYRNFRQKLVLRNNQNNILHLRNRNSGGYVFSINRSFFYLADPHYEGGKFRSNIYGTGIEQRKGIVLHKGTDFDWIELPSGWSNTDVALVQFRKNLKELPRIEGPDGSFGVLFPHAVLRKGELLMTYENGTSEQVFRYDAKVPDNLLVKHLDINGRSAFYYMNNHIWYKNLTDMLAESYVSPQEESFQLTIDVGLTRRVDSLLSRLDKRCSVVALDTYGHVKLMSDYKASKTLDPNDRIGVEEAERYNYLNPNSEQERLLFSNLNLMPMSPGPGSSLKPITLAAVMSEAPHFPWENLKLLSPIRYQADGPVKWMNRVIGVKKFGDFSYHDLYVLSGDEVGDGSWVNNLFFLSRSSNLYHGLILSLGFKAELPDRLGDSFPKAEPSSFPQFTVGNGLFSLNGMSEWSSNSILSRGMYKNFGINAYRSYVERDSLFLKGVSSLYYPWVWPSASYLLDDQLHSLEPSVRLRQVMLGSYPWTLTPLKMAEMYGKLYSLHPDYAATVIPTSTKPNAPWNGPDGKLDDAFKRMQNSVFKGMRLAATEGTARWIKDLLPKDYFYYAKTGTIGNYIESDLKDGFQGQLNDRMVCVVVSDKDILSAKSAEDYRFWVIYVRMEKVTDTSALREIVRCVVESPSLQLAMKDKLND